MAGVPTSAGDVHADDLGVLLMHQHVFIRTKPLHWGWPGFGGWDEETEVAAARERLGLLKRAGVDTILDTTVPGLGRDPALVARAVAGTGLKVMFATGYYTYDNLPFPFPLPRAGQGARQRRPCAGVAVRARSDRGDRRHGHQGRRAQGRE